MSDGNNLMAGRYVSPAPTLANGQVAPVRVSEAGELMVAVGSLPTVAAPTRSTTFNDNAESLTAESTEVLSLGAMNAGAVAVFVQVFAKATAPAPGDVPAFVFIVPAGGGVLVDATWWNGAVFAPGLAIGVSSTHATYTAAAFSGVVELLHRAA